jgi:hypothetical protein
MQRQEAEEHLRVIRSLMEKATIYRAIAAPTALAAGLLALVASYAGYRAEHHLDAFSGIVSRFYADRVFILIWLAVLGLVSALNGWFLWQDARRRGDKFVSNGMKMALVALFPSHLTTAVFSVAYEKVPQVLVLIWMIFHGIGLLATSHFSPRSMTLLGWAFFAAGLVAFIAHHSALVALPSPHVLMAVTFGGFHLIYAACTWPRGAAEENA